jgi:hypothetical protein
MTEYIVTIKDRRRLQQRRRQTMVLPGRHGDDLGRRRGGPVYLNYWDMGQLTDGTDIDFSKQCTISEIRLDPFAHPSLIAPEVVYDYNDYKDDIFTYFDGIGKENFDAIYKQIDDVLLAEFKAEQLSLVLTGDTAYVPGKGFRPEDASLAANEIAVGSSQRTFNSFATDDTINYKVTTGDTYASTETPFVLDKSCDVFLVPQIQLWEGRNEYVHPSGADPHFNFRSQLLGLFLAAESREFTINNTDWDNFKIEFDAYLASVGGGRWMLDNSFSTTYHSLWIDLFKNHPASRLKYYDFGSDVSFYPIALTEASLTSDAPGTFLDGTAQGGAADFSPAGALGLPTWLYGPWVGLRAWHKPEGLLLAVIRKNPNNPTWYYVWQKVGHNVGLFHSGNENTLVPATGGSIYGGVKWFYNT